MMKKFLIPLFLLSAIIPLEAAAQCSDAGACTIGVLHDDSDEDARHHRVAARYIYGSSGKEDDLSFHTLMLEASVQLFAGSHISLTLPWTSMSGPLGSTEGIGDLILIWDQRIWNDNGLDLRAQAGGKIATGEVNAGGLPQAYQPGLGTNDLLFGVNFSSTTWNVGLGYQYSDGRSENTVDRLYRGDDLLARAGYRTNINDYNLGLELIAIKRLSESSVLDPEHEDQFIDVPDSDQLQVNLMGNASAPISDNLQLLLYAAVPLLQRDINIDGLTRSLTLSLGAELSL